MKKFIRLAQIFMIGLVLSQNAAFGREKTYFSSDSAESRFAINLISGQIWSPYNRPVSDIYVELTNELSMTVARYRTTGNGRYEFTNLTSGSFKVKVLTTGTDYLEQIQDVQIINIFAGASDQQIVDFHLKFDPRKVALGSGGLPEEIFVQDNIAESARKLYRNGMDMLSNKQDKGLLEIEKALKISPHYFDALNKLGKEYVERKEYEKSLPYLIKAIDINQRSFSSFYGLAYACYQLNQKPEALEAARAATIIKPASVNAQLLYGTILRISSNYEKAEQVLVKAKNLSKKTPVAAIHWQLALLYNKINRNKEAADELEMFLKIQPKTQDAEQIKDLIAKLRTEKK